MTVCGVHPSFVLLVVFSGRVAELEELIKCDVNSKGVLTFMKCSRGMSQEYRRKICI